MNRDKKWALSTKQQKKANAEEQNKEELGILLIRLSNGENTMQGQPMIEIKLKNFHLKRRQRMLAFPRRA